MPLHREMGRLQKLFNLQQPYFVIVSWLVLLSLMWQKFSFYWRWNWILKFVLYKSSYWYFFLKQIVLIKIMNKNLKNTYKETWKIQFIFRCFNSRNCHFTGKWTSSQMILKNAYLKGHLLVTASKWRWFYDFQVLWEMVKTWSLQVFS